ncbi:hypothetical protein QLQ15_02460 [Lysobacter sp. LF1]|uniref:DUF1579 domain-containing protein n=1 Tax=Lysobacter stagni TaxID=3045172 RepID=A0ABT6XCA4_9GAMM|nr:hypothetical protein [Lysobacter sp. LF1]MDI9237772.1 hypothetical protein [Lysobacter sp. LF1]
MRNPMLAMNAAQERCANLGPHRVDAHRWSVVRACAGLVLALAMLPNVCNAAASVDPRLVPDTALAIPPLHFDSNGALLISPSATSSRHDFDYLVGNWKLTNRKLKSRLTGSTEWLDFESRVEMHQILDGLGNIDKYTEQSAKPYEGVALRLFDPATRLWSIYWADGNSGHLDPPVVGSFENKVGHFFARDTYKGRNIIVVFRWDIRNPQQPIWSQAFSTDDGKTWEWNSINVSERVK